MQRSTRLNPAQRDADIAAMGAEVFDVVVIGGGVTGCGVALDAAARGLSVALVEQRDFASGTSSRSSKLIHGGLRYLEQFNFRLVREALAERNLMLTTLCPHLVEPVSFLYPLKHRVWERGYVGAGILLYDALAAIAGNPLPRHRHLSKRGALKMAPGLDPSALHGGILYWDAQVNDARHTMTLARTAAGYGARIATSVQVRGIVLGDDGHVAGVRGRDLETGTDLTIRARQVISATGVWTDEIDEMVGDHALDVRASKGAHLVVRGDAIDAETGLILRTDKSVLFVIPWHDQWIIGTTDTPWTLGLAHPSASRADVDYIIGWANTVLSSELTTDDIIGVYAGLRPLLTGESEQTSRLSREHAVRVMPSGLISIAGGKYTTYRIMARDAVDAAAERLDRAVPDSPTHRLALTGERRGDELNELIASRPDLGESVGASRYRWADIMYAVTDEGALHLDDVLARRTRISVETPDRGVEVVRRVAELIAPELGWSAAEADREVEIYEARVDAERAAHTQSDERLAEAARESAPDSRFPDPSPHS